MFKYLLFFMYRSSSMFLLLVKCMDVPLNPCSMDCPTEPRQMWHRNSSFTLILQLFSFKFYLFNYFSHS